jgi:hypothetical protein
MAGLTGASLAMDWLGAQKIGLLDGRKRTPLSLPEAMKSGYSAFMAGVFASRQNLIRIIAGGNYQLQELFFTLANCVAIK